MGLYHRIPRELKNNFLRYLALFFLITLCMYVVVGIVGAADAITNAVSKNAGRNHLEDGQFTVFTPLSQSQLMALERDGANVEPMFYLDFVQSDSSVLRVFQNREEIDLVQPDTGRLPGQGSEVLLEKLYAGAHELAVGDSVSIGGKSFTVCGTGSSPDYDSPLQNTTDVATDKQRFGVAFVDATAYRALRAGEQSRQGEEYLYAYRLEDKMTHNKIKDLLREFHIDREAVTDQYFLELLDELDEPKNELLDGVAELVKGGSTLHDAMEKLAISGRDLVFALTTSGMPLDQIEPFLSYVEGVTKASDGVGELSEGLKGLQEEAGELANDVFGYDIENLTSFLKAENNPRIAASADDVSINKAGGILAGVIVLILVAYVISVFIVHHIDSDSVVVGTLYAMGVPKGALLRHYLALPVIVAALGGICGTSLGFSSLGVAYQMQDTASYFSYPDPAAYYPAYLLIYGLMAPPLVAAAVNWLVIRSHLARPPLELLRKEPAKASTSNLKLKRLGFIGLFRIRQVLREKRAAMAVCGGMFIALLLLVLGLNCYSFITTMQRQNAQDIHYEVMASLKYPPDEIPEGATAGYMQTLTREIYGYELDVTLLGISERNPYFDFTPSAGQETLTVSSSMANKFHLAAGDDVILADTIHDKRYVFTVDRIVPYSVGLYAFMDIGSMRELFGAEDSAYNILLADSMPDIEAGRVYSITTKDDILRYGDIFLQLLTPMIVMMVTVAVVVFVIVMYLMAKMMIDRSAFGISLMKIFGFNDGEVRKLYLDGNFFTVVVSALICIPLSKLVMDTLYPYMIANVAFGPDMRMPPWMYAVIFGLILGSYLCISLLLNRNLKKVTPAVVLKQRE